MHEARALLGYFYMFYSEMLLLLQMFTRAVICAESCRAAQQHTNILEADTNRFNKAAGVAYMPAEKSASPCPAQTFPCIRTVLASLPHKRP